MNQAIPKLQILIHKVDGATTTFIQNDADEAKKILDGFEPKHIFDRNRFVITDGNSITSLPVGKITRIDLISDLRPHLLSPIGIVEAVELTETEFLANLIRLTFFPKPVHGLADVWQVGQSYSTSVTHSGSNYTGTPVLGNPPQLNLSQQRNA